MNPIEKKQREALLAQRIFSTTKSKKHTARPVQTTKRVSIAHLLKPRTTQ